MTGKIKLKNNNTTFKESYTYIKSMWALWLSMFCIFVGMTSLWPALPFLVLQFGASPFELGLFIAALPLTGWVAAIIFGRLSDIYNRKTVLLVVISLALIFHSSYYFANSLFVLLLLRLFHGIGGATLGCLQSLLVETTPAKHKSTGLATLGIIFGFGLILGASTTAILVSYDISIKTIPLIGGSIMAVGSLIFAIFFKYKNSQVISHKKTKDKVHWQSLWPYLGVFFILGIGFTGIEGTFALWANQIFSLHAGNVGIILATSAFANILGHGFVGGLSKKIESKTIALIGLLVLALGTIQLISHNYIFMVYLGMGLLGFGMGLFLPSQQNLISSIAGKSTGTVMGTNQSLQQVARIIGPPLAGFIYQNLHTSAPFVLMGTIAICLTIYGIRNW